MNKLVTLAVFDNTFDVKFNLLKAMLDEAGIGYITSNDNARSIKPMPYMTPSNIAIDLKVYEENLEEAVKIFRSIE